MPDFYIGLMSGTSMDGIDAVIAEFGDNSINIAATHERPYPDTLRRALLNAVPPARSQRHIRLKNVWPIIS